MSDALAASLANDAPLTEAAPAPVETPSTPAAEPSRRDTIREAVEAQKAKVAAPDSANPDAPAKIAAKVPASPAERVRDPTGKFAPTTDRPAPDRAAPPAQAAPVEQTGGAPAPGADDTLRPPPGWAPASKVAFDNLPAEVKSDIAKREREINQGFAKLAELKPVEKFAEMAKRGGTTLDAALENYVGIETLLRRDVFAGVEQVLKNVGVNPLSFARAYLQRSGGGDQTPGQQTAPATYQTALDPQTLVRQASEAAYSRFQQEHAQREALTEVQRFEADPKNRFYANVKPTMARLIQNGFATTIQDAYDQACRLDPEISRLINAPPAPDPRKIAADQARSAARATVGAPSSGQAMPKGNGVPDGASRKDVIRAAVAAQRGGRA